MQVQSKSKSNYNSHLICKMITFPNRKVKKQKIEQLVLKRVYRNSVHERGGQNESENYEKDGNLDL